MGLYYNLLRLRSWADVSGIVPSIPQALEYLARQDYPDGQKLFWRMQRVYEHMHDGGCTSAVQTLEAVWRQAVSCQYSNLSDGVQAVALIDFPRYFGASWPHNDIAVYIPTVQKAAVMKLSDSKFEPLRQRLMKLTKGTDPFIGASFKITHSGLHPIFNRIRCSRGEPLPLDSYTRFDSFRSQLAALSDAYFDSHNLTSHFSGQLPLELDRYVIARYGSNYALMRFIVSDVDVVTAVRQKSWDYSFKFDISGQEVFGWMFRNSIFDPITEPETFVGRTVRLAAFALVGNSALDSYRAHLHVIAIHPVEDLMPLKSNQSVVAEGPTIAEIEEELLGLDVALRERYEIREPEPELEHELIVSEDTKAPQSILVRESDFPPMHGRILVLMSSRRWRDGGFRLNDMAVMLRQEGFAGVDHSSVTSALRDLVSKELVYQNIFGDEWFLNPTMRVEPSSGGIPVQAVEAKILGFLRKIYPNKITFGKLAAKFCQEDSRITVPAVNKAVRLLLSSKMIFADRKNRRYYANPSPPKPKPAPMPAPAPAQFMELAESEVLKIPDVAFAHQSEIVYIYKGKQVVRKQWVHSWSDSTIIVRKIISEIKTGSYTALEYEDHLEGRIRIWGEAGILRGTYCNLDSSRMKIFTERLGNVNA
jgi:hypothetical protein